MNPRREQVTDHFRRPAEQAADIELVVEHAVRMTSGSMQVRNARPDIEQIYPLESWIFDHQRHRGTVYQRTVKVIEDWMEVEP